jgi:hypothetical protein
METFSLMDDECQSNERTDLHPCEMYKTRLLRVDLGPRSLQDPFQRHIHKILHAVRYWSLSRKLIRDEENVDKETDAQMVVPEYNLSCRVYHAVLGSVGGRSIYGRSVGYGFILRER